MSDKSCSFGTSFSFFQTCSLRLRRHSTWQNRGRIPISTALLGEVLLIQILNPFHGLGLAGTAVCGKIEEFLRASQAAAGRPVHHLLSAGDGWEIRALRGGMGEEVQEPTSGSGKVMAFCISGSI